MTRPLSIISLAAVALLSATTLQASFFMRQKASSAQMLKAIGGTGVSSADALVNGAEAKIQVFGFDGPMSEVVAEVRKAWNLPEIDAGRSFAVDGAWITHEEGGGEANVLILPGGATGGCSVWLVETEVSSKDVSITPPGGNPFPAAELKSCIQLKGSGTVLTVHETTGGAVFSLREVEAGMAALGWETVLQGDSASYFAKDGHAAAAVAHEADGMTRVSVIRTMSR